MQWSLQQEHALKEFAIFMADPSRQVFYLSGFAGTGKSTLAMEFANLVSGTVLWGAFTGKAAYVLRQKGCANATTIHALMYIARDKSRQKLREAEEAVGELCQRLLQQHGPDYDFDSNDQVMVLRRTIQEEEENLKRPMFVKNMDSPIRDAALVGIDECSMVDQTIGEDLLSFGTKILVLGDPGQLPPVYGTGYFTERTPDVVLTDIHRQAADNPILWMATQARLGKSIPLGTYGESRVVAQEDVIPNDVLLCDQMLVGRNNTRKDSNVKLRKMRMGVSNENYYVYPVPGDRLVCLRNDHNAGLLNGAIWHVEKAGDPNPQESTISLYLRSDDEGIAPALVTSHTHYFEKRGEKLPWFQKKEAQEFDYGYALTVHKSQGSQWDNVLLFDESYAFREYRSKWLYTGITRAAEKLTLVRM